MANIETKVEALLAKHPHLTKPEALKIVTEKNKRKRDKRSAANEKSEAKRLRYEAKKSASAKTPNDPEHKWPTKR